MSICRTSFRAGTRSLSRPNSVRVTPVALHFYFLRHFFNLNKASTIDLLSSSSTPIEHHIKGLTTTNDLHLIHTHYTNLAAKLKENEKLNSFPTQRILTETQIHKILWLLAKSGRPSDIQKIHDILLDMPLVLGLNPTRETHTAIIRGFIYKGDHNHVRTWLENMPKLTGNHTPSLEQYHLFLEALADMEGTSLKHMRGVVSRMRPTGCVPTIETFKVLLIARMKLGDKTGSTLFPVAFKAVFDDIEREGIPYDSSFGKLILDEYSKRNLAKFGDQIRAMYEERFCTESSPGRSAPSAADLKLMQMAQTKGMRSAIEFFRRWKPTEMPSSQHINAMLRQSRHLSDLQLLQREFKVKCDVVHWSLLINNNVRAGKVGDAFHIYKAARAEGIVPDAPMSAPLIRFLCQATPNRDEEQYIGLALWLYNDLRKAQPPEDNIDSQRTEHDARSFGPDYDIYATLLRGLATTKQPYKYLNIALELMEDMAKRDFTPDDSNMVSSIVVMLMRTCNTVEEALEVYRKNRMWLDEKGYANVLNAFCKLRFGKSIQIPSLKGYFEMVKDMRIAGLAITVEVYTILLHQLGLLATQIMKDGGDDASTHREKLVLTLRRVHDLLTLDASLSPDTALWNQMMNTYQRLGCFGDAYRVWELIYLSSQYDSTSVSTIFDACAYAGAHSIAKKITERLTRDNYQFTSHNRNTWLECLCRLGRLDEAVNLLCSEGEGSLKNVDVDVESVQIVFKFARNEKKEVDVLVNVRAALPHIWGQLPSSIRELI